MWNEIFSEKEMPNFIQIKQYINNSLWEEMIEFIEDTYKVEPLVSYSGCSMQSGWNVKYKKSGKALCTLYPMKGYFICLIVIGNKEVEKTEMILPSFSEYIQQLYQEVRFSCGGKWLMINVTSKKILEDTKDLIKIRSTPKEK